MVSHHCLLYGMSEGQSVCSCTVVRCMYSAVDINNIMSAMIENTALLLLLVLEASQVLFPFFWI